MRLAPRFLERHWAEPFRLCAVAFAVGLQWFASAELAVMASASLSSNEARRASDSTPEAGFATSETVFAPMY